MTQIYIPSSNNSAIRQGEILSEVIEYVPETKYSTAEEDFISFTKITHPFAIVATQDCDLDWDYKARQEETGADVSDSRNYEHKKLNSIILCEVYTAREVKASPGMNSKAWDRVKTHRDERYYFLELVSSAYDSLTEGIDELTVDFKRIFGVTAGKLYEQIDSCVCKRRSVLTSPYLQHFSARYSCYHSRVALPEPYKSIP